MFKKRMRVIAVPLAVALCFTAALAGACGETQNKIKISVGFWQSGATAEEQTWYDELKDGFESRYPQYEIVASGYTYSEKTVTAKYVSGQLPTVFEMKITQAASAFRSGYIRDAAPLLKQYGWYEKTDPSFMAEILSGSCVYGIPDRVSAAGMLLNLKMLCDAGVISCDDGEYVLYDESGPLYPDTFAEIEDAVAKIYARYGKTAYGVFLPVGDEECGQFFANMIYNFGCENIEYVDENGVWAASFSQEAVGNAMRWVKTMSQNGYIDTLQAYEPNDMISVMESGKAAIAFCMSDALSSVSVDSVLAKDFAFVPMPTEDGGTGCSLWNGTIFAISARASDEQAEGVMKFLRYAGYGPETDEVTLSSVGRRYACLGERGYLFLPEIPVWTDDEYRRAVNGIYLKYGNVGELLYGAFFDGVSSFKRAQEPFCRSELYSCLDSLQTDMIFAATSTNIVTLIEEAELTMREALSGVTL